MSSLDQLELRESEDIGIDHTMSGVLRNPCSGRLSKTFVERRVSETILENTYNSEITSRNVDVASISRNQTQFVPISPRNQEPQFVGIFPRNREPKSVAVVSENSQSVGSVSGTSASVELVLDNLTSVELVSTNQKSQSLVISSRNQKSQSVVVFPEKSNSMQFFPRTQDSTSLVIVPWNQTSQSEASFPDKPQSTVIASGNKKPQSLVTVPRKKKPQSVTIFPKEPKSVRLVSVTSQSTGRVSRPGTSQCLDSGNHQSHSLVIVPSNQKKSESIVSGNQKSQVMEKNISTNSYNKVQTSTAEKKVCSHAMDHTYTKSPQLLPNSINELNTNKKIMDEAIVTRDQEKSQSVMIDYSSEELLPSLSSRNLWPTQIDGNPG